MNGEDRTLIERLREYGDGKPAKVLAGFDGYVDTLVSPRRSNLRRDDYFEKLSEFASFVSGKSGKSSDISVTRNDVRVGGNAPLFAISAAAKNMDVSLIGALGYPRLNPYFEGLEGIGMYSVAEPGDTYALEFSDGKIMLGYTEDLDGITYESIKDRVGEETLKEIISCSSMIHISNWSGLINSNGILEGIFSLMDPSDRKKIFIDLADPSGRSGEDFKILLRLLKAAGRDHRLILSFNEKEFSIFSSYVTGKEHGTERNDLEEIMSFCCASEISVHMLDRAVTMSVDEDYAVVMGNFVEKPLIVTGGGDNFNGGYALGSVLGFPASQCARLGNISSYIYVTTGRAADIESIIQIMERNII